MILGRPNTKRNEELHSFKIKKNKNKKNNLILKILFKKGKLSDLIRNICFIIEDEPSIGVSWCRFKILYI